MPKIEIEESELQDYQKLRGVVEAINKHPKGGLLLEEAHKLVNPQAKTPRLDQVQQQLEPLEAMKKEMADLKKQLAEKDAENEKNSKLTALQKKIDDGNSKLRGEGWTDDGIKMLDKFREEQGILDPIAAAAYYEKLNGPQVAPVVPTSHLGNWDFQDIPKDSETYAKKLLDTRGNSETLAMQEAMKSLKDFRGQTGR